MRELLVETASEEDELGEAHSYQYYILVDEMEVGRFACESYGVKVSTAAGDQTAAVPHVTVSAGRIDALMQMLIRNAVTPTSLPDVVADWL
ncbi:MAG: DUF6514 family protein [Oscillospiraceae bacterium]